MQTEITLNGLHSLAERARYNYYLNRITREEAYEQIAPYLEEANKRRIELAKKYNHEPKLINIDDYLE